MKVRDERGNDWNSNFKNNYLSVPPGLRGQPVALFKGDANQG
jgi:hypothetical protein